MRSASANFSFGFTSATDSIGRMRDSFIRRLYGPSNSELISKISVAVEQASLPPATEPPAPIIVPAEKNLDPLKELDENAMKVFREFPLLKGRAFVLDDEAKARFHEREFEHKSYPIGDLPGKSLWAKYQLDSFIKEQKLEPATYDFRNPKATEERMDLAFVSLEKIFEDISTKGSLAREGVKNLIKNFHKITNEKQRYNALDLFWKIVETSPNSDLATAIARSGVLIHGNRSRMQLIRHCIKEPYTLFAYHAGMSTKIFDEPVGSDARVLLSEITQYGPPTLFRFGLRSKHPFLMKLKPSPAEQEIYRKRNWKRMSKEAADRERNRASMPGTLAFQNAKTERIADASSRRPVNLDDTLSGLPTVRSLSEEHARIFNNRISEETGTEEKLDSVGISLIAPAIREALSSLTRTNSNLINVKDAYILLSNPFFSDFKALILDALNKIQDSHGWKVKKATDFLDDDMPAKDEDRDSEFISNVIDEGSALMNLALRVAKAHDQSNAAYELGYNMPVRNSKESQAHFRYALENPDSFFTAGLVEKGNILTRDNVDDLLEAAIENPNSKLAAHLALNPELRDLSSERSFEELRELVNSENNSALRTNLRKTFPGLMNGMVALEEMSRRDAA